MPGVSDLQSRHAQWRTRNGCRASSGLKSTTLQLLVAYQSNFSTHFPGRFEKYLRLVTPAEALANHQGDFSILGDGCHKHLQFHNSHENEEAQSIIFVNDFSVFLNKMKTKRLKDSS